jgi:hypothetical protein
MAPARIAVSFQMHHPVPSHTAMNAISREGGDGTKTAYGIDLFAAIDSKRICSQKLPV